MLEKQIENKLTRMVRQHDGIAVKIRVSEALRECRTVSSYYLMGSSPS